MRATSVSGILICVFVIVGCGKKTREKDAKTKSTKSKTSNKTTSVKSKPAGKSPKTTKPEYALPKEFAQAGTIKLFDGHSLFGWQANSQVEWKVVDGVITAEKGKPGLLLTTVPFADYELSFECRLEKGGNSGVFLRTVFDPKDPGKDCYEYNLCDTHESHATGSLVKRKVADKKVETEGQWQKHYLQVLGNRIIARIGATKVLDFKDESAHVLKSGFIGLQFREGKIEFRNIRLTPLRYKIIPFTNWKPTPGSKATIAKRFEFVDLKAGKGNLQSDAEYGDFLLQVDVRTNAKDVNSGIFFRAMKDAPNQSPNGYELQVHNGFADGDRTKPNDYKTGFGTGSIFRFAKVRRVIPDDKEWFTLTLVAHGNRFATWVNGYQVVDFVDKRKPNENPRRGQRLKAGYLFLQSHDPSTDVSFRRLKIYELPAKK